MSRVHLGYYLIQRSGATRYHLSLDGDRSMCGIEPCALLNFTGGTYKPRVALEMMEKQGRLVCKTCKKLGTRLKDAITQLGDLAREDG